MNNVSETVIAWLVGGNAVPSVRITVGLRRQYVDYTVAYNQIEYHYRVASMRRPVDSAV